MRVGRAEAAVRDPARIGVEARAQRDRVVFQRGGDGDRLHRRTGLDEVGHRAVAVRVAIGAFHGVGVVGRQVRHRQHFAGGDVEHDGRTAARALFQQRVAQFAIGEELDAAVDRQREVLARQCGADEVDVLDDAAAAIADHLLRAGRAAQPFVERQLQAFLAAVVDVGEAEHVRDRVALRIEAAVFALREHAGDAELDDCLRRFRAHAALQVDEFLRRALRELAREMVGRHAERLGEFRDALGRLEQQLAGSPRSIRPAWTPRAARRCGR